VVENQPNVEPRVVAPFVPPVKWPVHDLARGMPAYIAQLDKLLRDAILIVVAAV
jgi:hypothetical protein